jgi:hypothetical protein
MCAFDGLTFSAGVLDNMQKERDAVFDEQHVRDDIKAVISALKAESASSEASTGTT